MEEGCVPITLPVVQQNVPEFQPVYPLYIRVVRAMSQRANVVEIMVVQDVDMVMNANRHRRRHHRRHHRRHRRRHRHRHRHRYRLILILMILFQSI